MRANAIVVLMAVLAAAAPVAAQSSVRVAIHVADTSGVPVADAQISVMRGLETVARAVTDAGGNQTLSIVPAGGDVDVIVRRIGYGRVDRFLNDAKLPTSLAIVMTRLPVALDTVRAVADNDVLRRRYFIDADAIEHSPRLVLDALDIVTKLRPGMLVSAARSPTAESRLRSAAWIREPGAPKTATPIRETREGAAPAPRRSS